MSHYAETVIRIEKIADTFPCGQPTTPLLDNEILAAHVMRLGTILYAAARQCPELFDEESPFTKLLDGIDSVTMAFDNHFQDEST